MASIEDAVREILKDLKELKSENRELHLRVSSFEEHHSRASSIESTVPRQVQFESASSASSQAQQHGDEERAPAPPLFRRDLSSADSPLTARSLHSAVIVKDPNIKLIPPIVEAKDLQNIRPKEFLEYFDNVKAFIAIWESQPGNKFKKFEDSELFAMKNLKPGQQKQLAKLITVIYDRSDLQFVAETEIGNQIFWHSVTTEMAKAKLSVKLAKVSSMEACIREIRRLKFTSMYGLIDPEAWDKFKKRLQEMLAHDAQIGFEIPNAVIKDVIISALPDLMFQKTLLTLFGPPGFIYGNKDLGELIVTIESRISTIMSLDLQVDINKSVAARDSQVRKFKVNAVQNEEESSENDTPEFDGEIQTDEPGHQDEEEQGQLLAFLAESAGKKTCDRTGTGPDGRLKCKFLGGSKQSCIFMHPESDLKLKGKGFSTQASQQHTATREHQASGGRGHL
jgi:hypothetical protein